MKQICTTILMLVTILAQAQTFRSTTPSLQEYQTIYRVDQPPAIHRDTVAVTRFIMYPKVNPKTGVTTEWTMHRKALLEVREWHNTREGNRWWGDCINCTYSEYWIHITFLLPGSRAPLPFTWQVLSDDGFMKDKEPIGEIGRDPDPSGTWGTTLPSLIDTAWLRGSSERGEERISDTLVGGNSFIITGKSVYPLFVDSVNVRGWGVAWNKPDTIQVIRMVSDTAQSTFWIYHDPTPRPEVVWMIADPRGVVSYLDRRKKPFPKYFKVWPLQ